MPLQDRPGGQRGRQARDVPYEVNQAGYVIHSAIHSARHDIACVLHTHTRAAWRSRRWSAA